MKPVRSIRAAYLLLVAAMAAVLPACATTEGDGPRARDAARLVEYEAHAGEPVDHFRYYNSINGWTPLGDSAIAVWTRPSEAWLLYFHGPCQDIEYTPAIALTNNMGRVNARFDKVMVSNRGAIQIPCHIREIRPLDVRALKAARKQDAAAEAEVPDDGE